MSHRVEQVRSTLQRAIQQVLAEGLSDPRTQGTMITVTDVTVSDDLRNATVMVSVLPDKKQQLCLHALEHASGYIRRRMGELVALFKMPQLIFRLDVSLKKQAEVMQAINQAAREHPGGNTSSPPDEGASDKSAAPAARKHEEPAP